METCMLEPEKDGMLQDGLQEVPSGSGKLTKPPCVIPLTEGSGSFPSLPMIPADLSGSGRLWARLWRK